MILGISLISIGIIGFVFSIVLAVKFMKINNIFFKGKYERPDISLDYNISEEIDEVEQTNDTMILDDIENNETVFLDDSATSVLDK